MKRLFLAVLLLVGCASFRPANVTDALGTILLVPGSRSGDAPAGLDSLEKSLVACVGRPPLLPLDSVSWRLVDADRFTVWGDSSAIGYSDLYFHRITLVTKYKNDPVLVKHELFHTLYFLFGHTDVAWATCGLLEPVPSV